MLILFAGLSWLGLLVLEGFCACQLGIWITDQLNPLAMGWEPGKTSKPNSFFCCCSAGLSIFLLCFSILSWFSGNSLNNKDKLAQWFTVMCTKNGNDTHHSFSLPLAKVSCGFSRKRKLIYMPYSGSRCFSFRLA